jgi:RecA-family ATPase
MSILSFRPAHDLPTRAEEQRWLVSDLWSEEAVGIVGGEPKSGKTYLVLDLAVSVAAGTPCLRRFPVSRRGRVLLYIAEDPLDEVRRRLEGICAVAGLKLADLDVQVITEPTLRLDLELVSRRLYETVAKLQPRLLILDPFVRLHRIDENASGEVAPLLAYLRELQRRHAVAVLVVHHAKKGAGRIRAGQALRGSSEFSSAKKRLFLRPGLPLRMPQRAQFGQKRAAAPQPRAGQSWLRAEDDHRSAWRLSSMARSHLLTGEHAHAHSR